MRASRNTLPLPSSTVLAAITIRMPLVGSCPVVCAQTRSSIPHTPTTPRIAPIIFTPRMLAPPYSQVYLVIFRCSQIPSGHNQHFPLRPFHVFHNCSPWFDPALVLEI